LSAGALACPICARELRGAADGTLACEPCSRSYGTFQGVRDLRANLGHDPEPWPVPRAELERALAALEGGAAFKAALEALLLELSDEEADRLMQLLRESRGAWAPLLRVPEAGAQAPRALLVGNALSGTAVALAVSGFEVTLFEPSGERLRFARFRGEALAPGRTQVFLGGDGPALPFAAQSFELVVQEDGLPRRGGPWGHDLGECRRVCAGELALVADNRLAYKRATGRRGVFVVPSPLAYARSAVAPRSGERSLAGYRRALGAAGFGPARAFALYPHAREFSQVVALDERAPRLAVGPKEETNRLKLLGWRAGLFPLFTPSFALFAGRSAVAEARTRAERVLEELGRRTGEGSAEIDQLIATRGNTVVILTSGAGGEADPRGRWCIHVPLSPSQRAQVERNHATLELLARRFAALPAPEALFSGEIEGTYLACERRLEGLSAPQLTGDAGPARRMLADASRHLAQLVVEPARPLGGDEFEELLGVRFDLVARFAAVPSTLGWLERMRAEAREALVGRSFPRVLQHADLRSKHVQVLRDGSVVGFLDWGSSEMGDLPYFDLLHLLVHERKQEAQLGAGEAWRLVRGREGLRAHEAAALEDHARRLGLDETYCRTVEGLYPVLVAAMAERNWDYSRPRWLHRQFEV